MAVFKLYNLWLQRQTCFLLCSMVRGAAVSRPHWWSILEPLGAILPCRSRVALNPPPPWYQTEKTNTPFFLMEWDVTVVTVFLSILNQMEFHLVQNRKENSYHDHLPFNVIGSGILVFSVQRSYRLSGGCVLQKLQRELPRSRGGISAEKFFLKFVTKKKNFQLSSLWASRRPKLVQLFQERKNNYKRVSSGNFTANRWKVLLKPPNTTACRGVSGASLIVLLLYRKARASQAVSEWKTPPGLESVQQKRPRLQHYPDCRIVAQKILQTPTCTYQHTRAIVSITR